MSAEQLDTYFGLLKGAILQYGFKALIAILLLLIGLKLAGYFANRFEKLLKKKEVDPSLSHFLGSVVAWILKIAVVISAIRTVGFETTSFVAILGSAGLAVGLALQGSLSNFAGGVLILLLKPFKVGDFIQAQGYAGTVDAITTFYTQLKTGDNQVIFIPNGGLANSSVVNVNAKPTRRVDFVFGIGYGDDIAKAKSIIDYHFSNDERVLKDPAHTVTVGALADSSVNLNARAWTKTGDYWAFYWEKLEVIKNAFDAEGISIPFPQRDVHLIKES